MVIKRSCVLVVTAVYCVLLLFFLFFLVLCYFLNAQFENFENACNFFTFVLQGVFFQISITALQEFENFDIIFQIVLIIITSVLLICFHC